MWVVSVVDTHTTMYLLGWVQSTYVYQTYFSWVYIAQREFGDAVDLVLKASTWVAENCHKSTDSARGREAALDLENRTQHLIQVLASELSTQKSFQGGPRTARNAVKLLCRLGRSSQAADLFLKHRDAILQASLKYVDLFVFSISFFHLRSKPFLKISFDPRFFLYIVFILF